MLSKGTAAVCSEARAHVLAHAVGAGLRGKCEGANGADGGGVHAIDLESAV